MIYIFDIDGTLADLTHRLHFIKSPDGGLKPYAERDWNSFNGAVKDDAPIVPVFRTLNALLASGAKVIFFSGRNEVAREDTEQWLFEYVDMPRHAVRLYMRAENDRRDDAIVKREMWDALPQDIKSYVVGVFDDRDRVVRMWRELGVQCFQCNYGDF